MNAVEYLERNLGPETQIVRWAEDRYNPELHFTIPARIEDSQGIPTGPAAVRPAFQILPDLETPGMADYLDDPTSRVVWSTGCPCQDMARTRPCTTEGGH